MGSSLGTGACDAYAPSGSDAIRSALLRLVLSRRLGGPASRPDARSEKRPRRATRRIASALRDSQRIKVPTIVETRRAGCQRAECLRPARRCLQRGYTDSIPVVASGGLEIASSRLLPVMVRAVPGTSLPPRLTAASPLGQDARQGEKLAGCRAISAFASVPVLRSSRVALRGVAVVIFTLPARRRGRRRIPGRRRCPCSG